MTILGEFTQYLATCVTAVLVSVVQLLGAPLFFALERARAGKVKTFKSILITGGSSGLGAGLAVAYAQSTPGVHIAITGRNEQRLNDVAERCRKLGATVTVGVVDVTDQVKLTEFIDKVDAEHPFDLAIANAGIVGVAESKKEGYSFHQSVTDVTNANILGVAHTVFPLIPKMCARRNGQVALMSSLSGNMPFQAAPDYSASKAYLITLGRAVRNYLSAFNVGLSVITPGFVRTDLLGSDKKYPFEITLEEALPHMTDGLARNVAVIAFPAVPSVITATLGRLDSITLYTLGAFFGMRLSNKIAATLSGQTIEKGGKTKQKKTN